MRRLSRVAGSIFPARGRCVRVRQACCAEPIQTTPDLRTGRVQIPGKPSQLEPPEESSDQGRDRYERRRPPPIQNSWIRQRSYARLCPLKSLLSVDERNPGQKPVDLMPNPEPVVHQKSIRAGVGG